MTIPNQTLSDQIEILVRQHIEAARKDAADAMERAFAATVPAPRTTRTASPQSPKATRTKAKRRKLNARRTPDELAALSEQLYLAIVANPGKTMAVLAPAVGATPKELHLPMMALKRDSRIRSVGQRQQMRYYPTVAGR